MNKKRLVDLWGNNFTVRAYGVIRMERIRSKKHLAGKIKNGSISIGKPKNCGKDTFEEIIAYLVREKLLNKCVGKIKFCPCCRRPFNNKDKYIELNRSCNK